MNRKALTSSLASLLLLGVALVALFGLTSLDVGPAEANEVTSVAGAESDGDVADEDDTEGADEAEAEPTELETSDAPEPVETAEAEPVAEVAGTTSLIAAGPFTGDVEVDFDPTVNPEIVVIADNGIDVGPDPRFPDDTISGWEIDDIRLHFVESQDTLFVGINFLNVGGDPEGDGDPASGQIMHPTDPTVMGTGTDVAEWGIGEAFSVLLDLNGDGVPEVIAGVHNNTSISGFQVAEAAPLAAVIAGLEQAYGPSIPNSIGIPPADTSATSPDIEFAISNVSALVNTDAQQLAVSAFAGSFVDGGFGEENVASFFTPAQFDNPLFGTPELTIEKSTNGVDADLPEEGPDLAVGSTATFTYVVTNTGDVDLAGIAVTDNIEGDICTIATLAVGESDTCTKDVTVTAGAYANVGTATGFEDDGTGNPTGDAVTATDPSHHSGLTSGIDVEKTLNGQDLDNVDELIDGPPAFPVGSTITFEFAVSNPGDLTLVDIALTDDILGPITCPETTLDPGASMVCEGDHVVIEGITRNEGSVTGQPVDAAGNPIGDPVTDIDPAHHEGVLTTISIEKATNGEDADDPTGPEIEAGDEVTFTYVVTNNGPAGVVDLVVTDDIEGEVCEIDALASGASDTCTLTTTAGIGEYANIGTVTGQPIDDGGNPIGEPLTATDPSHHVGVCTNAYQGPVLYKGSRVVWDTGLITADNSTIVLTTTENGGSPGQPNEQVYLEVGGEVLALSPVGLGTITVDIEEGGAVRVLHISEVDEDIQGANSVVPSLCGDGLAPAPGPICPTTASGPRMFQGDITVWESGLTAEAGSEMTIVTSDPISDLDQPNEQVYVRVGDELYGPTPAGRGEITLTFDNTGEVTFLHYSEINGRQRSANSVEFEFCGTGLTQTVTTFDGGPN